MGISDQIGEDEAAFDSGLPVVRVTCLADVAPQPVRWLWPGRIALGKLTLICGDPGLGKSFLTLDLAARLSTGRAWPDGAGSTTGAGSAVLITAEDDMADTIRPRLDAAGADASRVVALDSVVWRDERGWVKERPFELADVEALRRVVARTPDCRLLVIDPVSAFVGGYDSHNNAEIRSLLAPLAKLAADTGVAVVAVTHLSKGGGGRAVYRAMGSLAFVAAARCAWLVARDRERPDRRLLLPIKNNLGDDGGGLAYAIVDGALAWERDPVTLRADDVLADAGGGGGGEASKPGPEQTARAEAADWLRELLADGPVAVAQVRHEAEGMGFAVGTLRRAREELGVRTVRPSKEGPYFWTLAAPAKDGAATPASNDLHNLRNCASARASAAEIGSSPSVEIATLAESDVGNVIPHPADVPSGPGMSRLCKLSRSPEGAGEPPDAPRAPGSLFHGPFGLPDVR